jgi:hypothetical protein
MFDQLLVRCGILLQLLPPVALPSHFDPVTPHGQLVGELARLHRQLGMSPLAGSSLEQPPQRETPTAHLPQRTMEGEFEQALHEIQGVMEEYTAADETAGYASSEPVATDELSLVVFLRAASRRLDQLANDLEEQRDYTTADALRGLSEALRQKARERD